MNRQRLTKVNQIAQTAREIYRRNAFMSVWQVDSVRTGKPYQVSLEWKNGLLTGKLFTFDHKEAVETNDARANHPANLGNSSICYQVLGATKAMAAAKGKVLSFCKSEKAAKNLSNLGGKVVKIVKPSGKIQWGVVK